MRTFLGVACLLQATLNTFSSAKSSHHSENKEEVPLGLPNNNDNKEHEFGELLSNSCADKEDGDYWFLLSSSSESYMPVYLTCSNGYIILDISKDSSLISYFSTFEYWHYAIAGPKNSDPCTWEEWFLPNENENLNKNSKFLISPSCDVCEENASKQVFDTKTAYWMSGNLAKLTWQYVGYNDCDMDKDTYSCFNCESCRNEDSPVCDPTPMEETDEDWSKTGICGTAVQASNRQVQYTRTLGMLHRTKPHFKPSIGTDGRFCVCYQPSFHDTTNYYLTEIQEEYLESRINDMESESESELNINNNNNIDSMVRVDGHEDENTETEKDLRETNIVYLKQKDFESGTYRIRESGTYVIMENIEFDFNKNDDYWPTEEQNTEDLYPGAAQYRDSYFMGFFAGITVEADYVTIDLNNFELKQSLKFYYQQRWFAIIELGSQQFLPGQGPGFFGPSAINVDYTTIKGGTLGLTSHFAIHGNFPSKTIIEDVHIRDFVTHGMQLNGWIELELNNVEIGPSSTIDYLKGDYGHGRLMHFRLRDLEKDLLSAGTLNENTLTFDGRSEKGAQTVTDIADELEYQMDLVLDYALNRVSGEFANNNYINPDLLDFDDATMEELERWNKAKDTFIHESGFPSSSSLTGIFLNFDGASVFTYTKYTTRKSKTGKINNLYIHDLKHDMFESMRIGTSSGGSGTSRMYTSPWLSDFPAQSLLGSKDKLIEFRNEIQKKDDEDIDFSNFHYVGTAITDAYIALGSFCDDWDYLGQELMYQTVEDDSIKYFAIGESIAHSTWAFGCNQDVMFHSGKGTLGLRVDGTDNLEINGLKIENLYELSDVGSLACGEYSGSSRNEASGEGGHLKQQSPLQVGFSGNNLQGVSIISSSNVKFSGDIIIKDIYSNTGDGSGLNFWTATDVTFDKDTFVVIKNVGSGTNLEKGSYTYESLPNRSPESCGVRLETDDSSELYHTQIIFEHENDNDNNGKSNIIVCNINGHESCLGNDENGFTIFGNYISDDESICDSITNVDELNTYLLTFAKETNVDFKNTNNNNNNNHKKNDIEINNNKIKNIEPVNEKDITKNNNNEIDESDIEIESKISLKNAINSDNINDNNNDKPNILMIMLDDLGRADIGAFGSEWPTPNIDSFIEESISLSHHYIGYVCSASRSQFLTGRHSFHNGYGTLDVFDRAKIGGIPQGTPTIADYLKTYSGYKTYAIGKWQLGYSFNEQTPNYRGFDYFWGFYGGLEDYFDKTAAIRQESTDPHKIKKDDTEYYDFWENMEPDYSAAGTYSTYQYLTKLTDIIDSHNKNDESNYVNEDPFFVYLALQAPHMPFPDEDTEFGITCDTLYNQYYSDMKDRDGVCEGMLGLDYFMGSFMDYLKNDKLKDVWENTLIIFTTDNGGALSHGSCNYPLRGGKNTYFEGNTRVHTFVGGGYIPDSERGSVRGGLFSNVDWLPTLLSFANAIPHSYKAISWNNDIISNNNIPFTFDGYNQYEYIMNGDSTPIRDHIIFQLRPSLDDNSNYAETESLETALSKIKSLDDINNVNINDNNDVLTSLNLAEIALIFYDEDGTLWKYFDTEESTNEIGNVESNCNWCKIAHYGKTSENIDEKYYYTSMSKSIVKGLFDLTTDTSESFNLYDNIDNEKYASLINIVSKNAIQYFDNELSESSIYLYGNFDCFYTKFNEEAWPLKFNNLWKPFLESDDFAIKLLDQCGFDQNHIMYKLHTQQASKVLNNINNDNDNNNINNLIIDRSELVFVRNKLVTSTSVIEEIKRQEGIYKYYNDGSIINSHKSNSILTISTMIILIGFILLCGIGFVFYKYCNCFNQSQKPIKYSPLF